MWQANNLENSIEIQCADGDVSHLLLDYCVCPTSFATIESNFDILCFKIKLADLNLTSLVNSENAKEKWALSFKIKFAINNLTKSCKLWLLSIVFI